MKQPETLQSLIDRLNGFNVNELEFKDIQIKAAELVKQVFPRDSATTVYQINTLTPYSKTLFDRIVELRSILEAKLETIARAEQARLRTEKDAELRRQQNESRLKIEQDNKENEYINDLQEKVKTLTGEIKRQHDKEAGFTNTIDSLRTQLAVRYRNNRIKDGTFWSVIVAICALFLFVGYYWGNSRFDAEKFKLKDERDFYKRQLDSIKKSTPYHIGNKK